MGMVAVSQGSRFSFAIPPSVDDSYHSLEMVLDGDGLLDVPYIGERLRRNSVGVPTARGKWVNSVLYRV